MDKTTNRLKTFVTAHKTAIAVTVAVVATTAAATLINKAAFQQHDNFLTEKGLFEEFYGITE